MFKGLITALITPFKYGEFDEDAYINLIEWQISSGVDGILACGSTGEAQTLTKEEQFRVIDTCIKTANGRVKVIAGTSSNSTAEALELTKAAEELGADGVLLVSPYYNKPGQEGLYQHFKTIHNFVNIPIILYNHPGRCSVDMSNETIIRLSKLDRVVGLKDASGNISRITTLYNNTDENFALLCGDDELALGFNAQGGVGCISVAANIFPSLCTNIQKLWLSGNWQQAFRLQNILNTLYIAISCETNPIPIKYAASLIDICNPDVRLPLVPLSERSKKVVRDAMYNLEQNLKDYDQNKKYCSTKP